MGRLVVLNVSDLRSGHFSKVVLHAYIYIIHVYIIIYHYIFRDFSLLLREDLLENKSWPMKRS